MLQMATGWVELLPVEEDMMAMLGQLKISPEQKRFVKPLKAKKIGDDWKQAAIVVEGALIGWVRYGLSRLEQAGADGFPNPVQEEENVWIDMLFIDHRYQGQGYGGIALQRLLGAILHEYRTYSTYIKVQPDNAKGLAMLEANGFRQTGETSRSGELILRHQF